MDNLLIELFIVSDRIMADLASFFESVEENEGDTTAQNEIIEVWKQVEVDILNYQNNDTVSEEDIDELNFIENEIEQRSPDLLLYDLFDISAKMAVMLSGFHCDLEESGSGNLFHDALMSEWKCIERKVSQYQDLEVY